MNRVATAVAGLDIDGQTADPGRLGPDPVMDGNGDGSPSQLPLGGGGGGGDAHRVSPGTVGQGITRIGQSSEELVCVDDGNDLGLPV